MSRLIDADALLPISASFDGKIIFIVTLNEIRNAPTVDAVPVVHGAWIEVSARELFGSDSDQLAGYVCSKCGFGIEERDADAFNYCPNCGANMQGGENDE